MFRNFLSRTLFLFNLQTIKIIDQLNRFIIKKIVFNNTILFNIQYVQRYTLIEVIFANYLKHTGYRIKGLVCAGHRYCESSSMINDNKSCQACRAKSFKILKAGNIEAVDLRLYKKNITKDRDDYRNFNVKEFRSYKDLETNFPLGETAYWNWLHYSNGIISPEENNS